MEILTLMNVLNFSFFLFQSLKRRSAFTWGREQGRRGQGKEGMEGERKMREVDKGKEVEEE